MTLTEKKKLMMVTTLIGRILIAKIAKITLIPRTSSLEAKYKMTL
jgi:hypothetical protein